MTDYKWEIKQRRKQKDLFLNYRNIQTGDGNATFDDRLRLQPSKTEVFIFEFGIYFEIFHDFLLCFLRMKSLKSITC